MRASDKLLLTGLVTLSAGLILYLMALAAYHLGKHNQREQSAVEAAQSITKAIQNRAGINETINNMDSVALCLELGGMREQCEQLRRLATDQR